jgi:hypothetical protein
MDKSHGAEAKRLAAAAELLAEPTFLAEVKKLTAAETVSNANRPAYLTYGGREAHHENWDVFYSAVARRYFFEQSFVEKPLKPQPIARVTRPGLGDLAKWSRVLEQPRNSEKHPRYPPEKLWSLGEAHSRC